MGNHTSAPQPSSIELSPAFASQLMAMGLKDWAVATSRVCVPAKTTEQCLDEGALLLTALRALGEAASDARKTLEEDKLAAARKKVKELQHLYRNYVFALTDAKMKSAKAGAVASACQKNTVQPIQDMIDQCMKETETVSAELFTYDKKHWGEAAHLGALLTGGDATEAHTLCVTKEEDADATCYDSPLVVPHAEIARIAMQLQEDVEAHAAALVSIQRADAAALKQAELNEKMQAKVQEAMNTPCEAEVLHASPQLLQVMTDCQATLKTLRQSLESAKQLAGAVVTAATDAGVMVAETAETGAGAGAGAEASAPAEANAGAGAEVDASTLAAAAHAISTASAEATIEPPAHTPSVSIVPALSMTTRVEVPTISATVNAEDAVAQVMEAAVEGDVKRAMGNVEHIVRAVVRMQTKDVRAEVERDADDELLDAPSRNPIFLRGFLLALFQGAEPSLGSATKRFEALMTSVAPPPAARGSTAPARGGTPAVLPPVEAALMYDASRRRLILRKLVVDPLIARALSSYMQHAQRRNRLAGGLTMSAPVVSLQEWEEEDLAGGGLDGGWWKNGKWIGSRNRKPIKRSRRNVKVRFDKLGRFYRV